MERTWNTGVLAGIWSCSFSQVVRSLRASVAASRPSPLPGKQYSSPSITMRNSGWILARRASSLPYNSGSKRFDTLRTARMKK